MCFRRSHTASTWPASSKPWLGTVGKSATMLHNCVLFLQAQEGKRAYHWLLLLACCVLRPAGRCWVAGCALIEPVHPYTKVACQLH